MKVLSLFDGISCGLLALKQSGFQVEEYYASEIEPNAIKVSKFNHPEIIHIGDVTRISYSNGFLITDKHQFYVGKIDLLCGGSPCTNFSSIGYANGMISGDIEILSLEQYLELKNQNVKFDGQSYLFWEFCRLINEVNPKYFLLENVLMAKKWEDIISSALNTQPIKINSALLSAQNRPRLYWTNIPDVQCPKNSEIVLDDILSNDSATDDVSHCLTVQRSFPKLIKKYGYIPERFNAYNSSEITSKACALSRGSMITSSCATLIFVPINNGVHIVNDGKIDGIYPTKLSDGRYNIRKLSLVEIERLQNLPDHYTRVQGISDQKRSEMIGNGWTVNVIRHIFSHMRVEDGN